MKKIIKIFIAFLLLFIYNNSYAGCFRDESKKSIIKTFPSSYCIDTYSVSGCIGDISLFIGIKCDKEFNIYDEYNRDIGLRYGTNYSGYNKGYNDYTITQENNTAWVRKLVNKNNSNEIYYIKGKNYHISYIIIKKIILLLLVLFLIGLLYKKRYKETKKFIKDFQNKSGKILGYSSLLMLILLTIVQFLFVQFYEYIDKSKITLSLIIFLNELTLIVLGILIIASLILLIIKEKILTNIKK